MAGPTPGEWGEAADRLLERLEASGLASEQEMDRVRESLAADLRADLTAGLDRLQTMKVGRARVLVPSTANLAAINLASQRVRERFSRFSVRYLNRDQVREAVERGDLEGLDVGQFVRHSRRLARHVRTFLEQMGQLEPAMRDEIAATLEQVEDAQNDLLKLEVRSWTNARETLLRMVQGRTERAAAGEQVRTFDLNRNLFNMSLLAHPAAVVSDMLARASDRMGERASESQDVDPKRAFVVVGVGPNAERKMTRGSRVAGIVWRVLSQADLGRLYRNINTSRTAPSTWRGLGLAPNTPEFYVPVPREIVPEVEEAMRVRRRSLMERLARGEIE